MFQINVKFLDSTMGIFTSQAKDFSNKVKPNIRNQRKTMSHSPEIYFIFLLLDSKESL